MAERGHVTGWLKGKEFGGAGHRNVELTVFHFVVTYTNVDGDTFTYRDVGPDRSYVDSDGNFVFTITGRPGDPLSEGFSLRGHVVITVNPDGDVIDVSVQGNQGSHPDDAACAALT